MKNELVTAALMAVCLATFKCSAAETSGNESSIVVATVLDKKITAADVGILCDTNNKPIIPANTPSTCLLRNPLDELRIRIMREVARDYIEKNKLNATDEEIRESQDFHDRHMAQDKIRRQKKLAELDKELQDGKLSAEEREQAEKSRQSYLSSLASYDKRLNDMNNKPTAEVLRSTIGPWVEGWKFNKSIYDKYGGVVGVTKFGPAPAGATKCLLEDYEKQGGIVIPDENLRRDFWILLSQPPRFTAKPEEIDFTPYWKKPFPENKE